MPTTIMFTFPAHLALEEAFVEDERLTLVLRSTQLSVPCPCCAESSSRVHSHYTRTLADLPCQGQVVQLYLHVRRFFCLTDTCSRKTFAEPFTDLAPAFARRTIRQSEALREVAFALGGKAGVHLAKRLAMPVSLYTLLPLIRRSAAPACPTPSVLGVDDFSWKKGDRYGTLLVDLERRCPIDMLPDREASSLARWLCEHPGVTIVSRDRAGAYADGVRRGAPGTLQVADRYHLMLNLRQTLKEALDRQGACLRHHVGQSSVQKPLLGQEPIQQPVAPSLHNQLDPPQRWRTMSSLPYRSAVPSTDHMHRQARRSQRLACYEAVRRLHQRGLSLQQIAHQLDLSLRTVRRFVKAASFPELSPWPKKGSKLDPYVPYLHLRWQEGCYNGRQLHHELQARGYTGSRILVSRFIADVRRKSRSDADAQLSSHATPEPSEQKKDRLTQSRKSRLSSQHVSWLFVCPSARLTEKQRRQLDQLCQADDQW